MVDGYMVYQYMVYISQYLPKLAAQAMHAVDFIWDVWDVNSIKIFEREQMLGKGTMKKVRGNI